MQAKEMEIEINCPWGEGKKEEDARKTGTRDPVPTRAP